MQTNEPNMTNQKIIQIDRFIEIERLIERQERDLNRCERNHEEEERKRQTTKMYQPSRNR